MRKSVGDLKKLEGGTHGDFVEEDEGVVALSFPDANVAGESAGGVNGGAGSLPRRDQFAARETGCEESLWRFLRGKDSAAGGEGEERRTDR